jgi:hypothetical protein
MGNPGDLGAFLGFGAIPWNLAQFPGILQMLLPGRRVARGGVGRYLVRLSDSLFLAPQSDLEKNQNAVRKGLARNAQIRGVFGSPP